MRNKLILLFSIFSATIFAQSQQQLLLEGWRFHKGAASGAEQISFDDTKWQRVSIPHDWAITGPFDKEIDKQVVAITQNGEKEATEKTGRSGSLPWIGEGWYRTELTIPEGYSHAEIQFDGAMAEPHVYLDGEDVGYWAYGYNTFVLDITNFLPRDRSANGYILPGKHILAVHLQNIEESSRWYPGAGLIRPVRLLLQQNAGIRTLGLFARTTCVEGIDKEGVFAEWALLTVTAEIRNDSPRKNLSVKHYLQDANGQEVATAQAVSGEGLQTTQVLKINGAQLWSPEHPVLYTLVTELLDGEEVLDRREMATGIRSIEYSAQGFKLNGVVRQFKGVCLHHDLGPLGAAFNKAAFRRQVALLKEIGCDAIRTSHNMPAPWQMDICDEMGMMVMAESFDMWEWPKCKNGYSRFFSQVDSTSVNGDVRPWWQRDLENLVLVHRNHPSIVMWSIGNEIYEQSRARGLELSRDMQHFIHYLDPTRPCTQGMDNPTGAIHSGVFAEMDVPGFNYRTYIYDKGQAASPKGLLLGSETCSTVSSRGFYRFPVEENYGDQYPDGQVSSYDLQACIWSNLPDDDWMWQDKAPWMIGEFVWTGFDYLGEPTPYDEFWPSRSSYFGIYDLAGLPKDRAFLYRTHWAPEKNTLHVLPHWNWEGREGETTPIFVYTSYPEAEVFINGKSQGRKRHIDCSLADYQSDMIEMPTPWGSTSLFANPNAPQGKNRLDRYRMRWLDTRYEPGELRVVAYDAAGRIAEEKVVRTAGKPHHIELTVDRSVIKSIPVDEKGQALDCPDLAFVTVRVLDKNGNLCPLADNQLKFSVKGNSLQFNSCCNGDATSLEVFTQPTMRAFNGELVVVLMATKTPGTSILTVSGQGLKSSKVTIEAY